MSVLDDTLSGREAYVKKGAVVMLVTPTDRRLRDLPQYTTWVIVDRLSDFRGPRSGYIQLPNHVWWNGDNRFNMDDLDDVHTAYPAILREAATENDLIKHINLDLFLHVWPELILPDRLKQLWISIHPVLATA